MGYLDTEHDVAIPVTRGVTDPSFFDSVSQGYQQQYRVDSPYSLEAEIKDRWAKSLDLYAQATGQPANIRMDLSAFNTYARTAKGEDPSIWQRSITGQVSPELAQDIANFKRVNDAIKALGRDDIQPFETALAEAMQAQRDVEDATARNSETGSGLDAIGQFLGAVGGSFSGRDPVTLATLGLGGFGRTIAMRVLTEGAVQGGLAAAQEYGSVAPNRELAGLPEGNPLYNIAASALLGSAIRGGVEGLGVLARRGAPSPDIALDFNDEQLASMFRAAPQSSEARGAAELLSAHRALEAVNPYGVSEQGTRRFVAELEDIQKLMAGQTDTAIARVIPDQPYDVQLLDADIALVKAEAPEVHAAYEAAAARVAEIDERLASIEAATQPTLSDAIARIDEDTANLVRDYEADLTNPQLTREARVAIEQKLTQIVESLGADRVAKELNDAAIAPKMELRTTRQSRKAAVKKYRVAKRAMDQKLAQIRTAQRIKQLRQQKAAAPLASGQEAMPLFYLRHSEVETAVARTAESHAIIPEVAEAAARTLPNETGAFDLGEGYVIPGTMTLDFGMPDGTVRKLSVADAMRDLDEDLALEEAMKVCAL